MAGSLISKRWPRIRRSHFFDRLASFARVIVFDKRGTGLSDRVDPSALPTLEQRMDDVRAVMDAANSDKAALVGVSEGGPMCALFSATYPSRTRALVTYGSYARWLHANDHPWAPTLGATSARCKPTRPVGGRRSGCVTWRPA